MYNATHNPETILDNRYLIRKTITERAGMTAMVGFDQRAEEEVFVKSRDSEWDENAARRVSREADILGSLHHPQIPALIDADPDAEKPYIITELKDENSRLTEGFKHNTHPVFAAELCVAALAPLAHAHESGITHRDVKPGNLLMTWAGDVALSDWEIALCKDRTLAEATYTDARYNDWRVTRVGYAHGSKGYMAPEQMKGPDQTPDARSDLYSMGVVLHFFLHGKLPVSGSSSNEDVVREIITPSNSYTPDRPVPAALAEISERALQENPDDRYQSALEMGEDLERYLHVAADSLQAAA